MACRIIAIPSLRNGFLPRRRCPPHGLPSRTMTNASFHGSAGRHSGIPENLHSYFIVRKWKWMNLSVKESKCESERHKEREIVLNWDTSWAAGRSASGKTERARPRPRSQIGLCSISPASASLARRKVALLGAHLIAAIVAIQINGSEGAVGLEVRRGVNQRVLAAQLLFDAFETHRHVFD